MVKSLIDWLIDYVALAVTEFGLISVVKLSCFTYRKCPVKRWADTVECCHCGLLLPYPIARMFALGLYIVCWWVHWVVSRWWHYWYVARRSNNQKVVGSRHTEVVCITVSTGNRLGWTVCCGRPPLLLPSCRKLEFRLSALRDSDLAWVNGKSGR